METATGMEHIIGHHRQRAMIPQMLQLSSTTNAALSSTAGDKIYLMALSAFGYPTMINRATHAARYSLTKSHSFWVCQTPKPINYFKPLGQLPYTASEQYQDMRVWRRCLTA
jgi:hypothetical protein